MDDAIQVLYYRNIIFIYFATEVVHIAYKVYMIDGRMCRLDGYWIDWIKALPTEVLELLPASDESVPHHHRVNFIIDYSQAEILRRERATK